MNNFCRFVGGKPQFVANRSSKMGGRERRHSQLLHALEPLQECESVHLAQEKLRQMMKEAKDGGSGMSILKGLSEHEILFERKEEKSFFLPRSLGS